MTVVSAHSYNIMREELSKFYAGGTPRRYVRTGQLGRSNKVTPLLISGSSISFDAYLDINSVHYVMPNPLFMFDGTDHYSHFTPPEVFDAAEKGRARIVGTPGFWGRSERRIEQDFNHTLGSFFR